MRRPVHPLFFISVIGLLSAQPAFAYEHPLSSVAVRNAYSLGKASASKREAFFAMYTRTFARPKSGPYISRIRVVTPYAYVVERTARALTNLLAPDAQQEFYGKPIALRVLVHIGLTPSCGWQVRSKHGGVALRNTNFWRDFTVRLIQHGATIQPIGERGTPDYAFAAAGSASVLVGADIDVQYDPSEVRSAPATVLVSAPGEQQAQATFALANLR
jgi:hypothetical protein